MSEFAHAINREGNGAISTTAAPSNRVALLLAGGNGTCLQELMRAITAIPIPKQYCRLLHGSSLLKTALSRAHFIAPRERISVVVNQGHLGLAKQQLRTLPESNIFVQPLDRDTGPGLIVALLQLEPIYPDAIVAVLPTDHYVGDERSFIPHALRYRQHDIPFTRKNCALGRCYR
jgi:mannose-1-phosphate guanylyltransferase